MRILVFQCPCGIHMELDTKQVSIKWNGKQLENIKACEGQKIIVLKRTIEESYGIPAKKQKLLFKGKFLKDENLIEAPMFETNQSIMLMGAAETVDVSTHLANASKKSESECADSSKIDSMFLGTGLKNLGNTCYINSTLQVLFGLNQSIKLFGDNSEYDPLHESFLNTMKSLKMKDHSISPLDFIMKLRNILPVYAEKDKYGLYIQHDVHEFWSNFISYLGKNDPNVTKNTKIFLEKKSLSNVSSIESVSNVFLPVTSETGSLTDSLSKAFSEKSDAGEIISNTFFSQLPTFLPFVFMRFMWKANEKVQAKILKLVSYSKSFDIYPYSNDSLKEEILSKRSSNPEFGRYSLNFLITHTGREADSGHYIAWSKAMSSSKSDEWFKFDDDKVSVVKEEEILKLGGGGDRPTAYMIFYLPSWINQNDNQESQN